MYNISFQQLVYFGSGRNRYQIEVPESVAKNIPDDYQFKTQRKVVFL